MTTISASSTLGITLVSSSYTNPVVINPGVTISNGNGYGIGAYQTGAWTLQNNGTIESPLGIGVYLGSGGSITNAASALISGVNGVNITGGSGIVVNAGSIAGNTTQSIGVLLAAGGSVTNQTGAAISGYTGVDLTAGGTVTNAASASITGVYGGVEISGGAGTVVNSGYVAGRGGGGIGVLLGSGGSATNAAAATITGVAYGVDLAAGGTLTNAGKIVGNSGTAIVFGGTGPNLLVLDPGYQLSGVAMGGTSATNTLELASASTAGTLSGLGTRFVNFTQTTINTGASWVFNGTDSIAAGTTLTELGGATLTVSGTLPIVGGLNGSGAVTIPAGAVVEVQGTIASGETVTLAGTLEFQNSAAANVTFNTGGVLNLEQPAGFSGTISNFLPGDTVFLSQNSFSSAGTATLLAGNTLQIVENSETIELNLNPAQSFSGATFHLTLDANNVDTDVTVTGSLPQAVAKLNTPGPFTLANQHVSATPLTDILSITNAAAAPAESLDVTVAGTTGSATGAGAITLLAAGATDSSDMSVGLNTGAAGVRGGTVTLDEYTDGSETDGLGKTLIGTSTLTVSGSVFNYATASAVTPGTVSFGNQHVGAKLTQTLSVSNTGTAGSFTEALDASIGSASGRATVSGSFNTLAAGATNASALVIGLTTTHSGVRTGTAVVTLNSDGGTGAGSIDGLGTTALTPQTITVSGTVFNLATASAVAPSTVSFGDQHVGATLSQTLSVSNTGSVSSFTEALDAAIGAATGSATAVGAFTSLAAGGTNASALSIGLSSTKSGALSGTAVVALSSDGGTGAGSIDGLGTTSLTPQTIAVSGTLFNYATASVTPDPVNFGAHHVGDTISQALTISNTGTANGFTENLDAAIGNASGSASVSGTIVGLAAGKTNNSSLVIGLSNAVAGIENGTAIVTLNSDGTGIDSLGTTALTSQTIVATATLYNLATPNLSTVTLNFGAARVGGALSAEPFSINDGTTASAFQESLAYNIGTPPSGFSVPSGGTGTVVSDGTATPTLALSTATPGNFNGSTIAVGLTSTGAGTSGLANTSLTTQTITLNGEIFAAATAQPSTASLNFGVVHVGDAVSKTLTITNTATGALTDVLTGGFGSVTSPFNGTGNLGAGLAAGNIGTLTVGLSTANSGVETGQAALSFASHDSLLPDVSVTVGSISLNGTIDNYATAELEKTSGAGSFIQTGTETGPSTGNNTYTLNFGAVAQGTTAPTVNLEALNAATGLADLLQGSFQLGGTTGFTNAGFTPLSGLGFGQTDTALAISLSTGTAGSFTETVTLTASGTNASGYEGTIAPDILTITGSVITTARTLVWTGASNSNFANAGNWDDTTSGLNPAAVAPDATDTVEFDSVGGAVSGTGTVATIDVGAVGSGALQLSGGVTLAAASLDAGIVATAAGQIGLTGVGTDLSITGAATVADDGTGVLSVLSGATFSAANLTIGSQSDSSGAVVVSGAGSAINLSGALNVGTANGTGDLTVGPGATIQAQAVFEQGQVVLEGGLLDPTVQLINQGQTAGGFGTIAAGDIVDEGAIQAGGNKGSQKLLIVQGTVLGGGTLTVDGTLPGSVPAGILQINAGGTLELSGAVLNAATTTFTDNLTPQGTYTVNNSVIDVNFVDGAGVLLLDDIAGFGGTITTFQAGDEFVITAGTLSGLNVSNGDTLTVQDSGSHAGADDIDQIIFGSAVSAAGFKIVNNNTIQAQVPCFAEGTRIATDHDPVAVERLAVGDRLLTADGSTQTIVWIGQREVNCRTHPAPETVRPVRVAAGAFGETVPARDLFLSPDHAVFVNGVLVPVKMLINGTSIAQVNWDRVRYFHVELPRHAVILAEGLSVESYLDTGDRPNFRGDDATIRLFPDFTARLAPDAATVWETRGAAPLVMAGEALTRARLLVTPHGSPQPSRSMERSASGSRLSHRRPG